VERRIPTRLDAELTSQLDARRERLARHFKQVAFGVLLKKGKLPLGTETSKSSVEWAYSGDQMNLGDQLFSRAYQLEERGQRADAARLRELTSQLELMSHPAQAELAAALMFLLQLADSQDGWQGQANSDRVGVAFVEIGSSILSRQQAAATHDAPPVYGQMSAVSSGQKAYMQYPRQLFAVPAQLYSRREGGRGFPVYSSEDFRLPTESGECARGKMAWGAVGEGSATQPPSVEVFTWAAIHLVD
jgi:hypothetical protein